MHGKQDYYEVLGIDTDADADQIKRAYRKGALKHHPDNYKGDKAEGEQKFKELTEAYEVLSDPVKRQRYDRFGHEGLRGSQMHDFSNMGFGDIFSMFSDILGQGFGGGFGATPGHDRGLDLETQIGLTLEQVATGVDQTLEFERMDLCDTCRGSGSKPGHKPDKCRTCGGYGQVRQQVQGFFGVSIRQSVCPDCHGKGTMITHPCDDCRGSGRVRKKRILMVHVPPGVRDGQVVRIRNEGEPNRDGTSRGDLHCYIAVKEHPMLIRRGNDLICQVPIAFSVAALGGRIDVPTLAGQETIDVPAGTQNGDVITIKKRGLPSPRGARPGDQHVQVFMEVPRKLTKEQQKLLEQYAKTESANITPQRKTFLKKLKDCFKPED